MVLLYQSNRLDDLFAQFSALVRATPGDPLVPETIVVHNQGMAQWVARQLALATGIAAHLHFPLPGRLVWDLLHRMTNEVPEEDLFRPAVLRWRVAAVLPPLLDHAAFHELAVYLRDDADGIKGYQLAGRISDVLDQYQVFRPDLLARWEHGEEDHWQARLWRTLTTDAISYRARLGGRFRELFATPLPSDRLPPRVHLFGLNSLAPVYLDIIAGLSRHIEVHLFHLRPCRHFWGDLVSARQLAGMRARGRQDVSREAYYDQGHPLLVALGTTGQDFFRQLLDCEEIQEIDCYREREPDHLLASLQNDILDLHDRSVAGAEPFLLAPEDRSVQFHCCCSALREIQVLHDRLLDLLQQFPDLTPGDILVSAPDMQRYAEAVAGVFGEAGQERRIPWSLADQPQVQTQPLVRCGLDLLELFGTRFTAPEVLALCETPALLRRFGLDPSHLPRLHTWVSEAGIRWGLDEAHRQELEIQAGEWHSWQFGLDRLLLGYLMGESPEPFCGLLPYGPLATGEGAELGGFAALIATLGRWRQQVQASRSVESWCGELSAMLLDFFDADPEDPGLVTLREAINGCRTDCRLAGYTEPVPFAVIKAHLQGVLAQPDGGQPFLSGRVTFCNMVPMRSVPFRVLCLLGMNDQDFPRSQHPVSFDRMAASPRLGDRNRCHDDRYLFLEALLSARDVFYLSWVGRNLRDDSIAPPSVVVSDLRDFLDQSCRLAQGETSRVADHLTTDHPMQPFSRRCYEGTATLASFNPCWLPAEQVIDKPPFLGTPLEAPGEEWRTVEIDQLVRFWRHPVRFFLEQILGLRLRQDSVTLEESEPFSLDPLQQYHLRRETIDELLVGRPVEQVRYNMEGSGRLPQGGFGRCQFAAIAAASEPFAAQLRPLLAQPVAPLEVDRTIGPFRLTGWLRGLCREGRISWRTGALRSADLFELWLHHLCLNLLGPADLPLRSLHLARDSQADPPLRCTTLLPVADAEMHLHRLFELYWQGLTRPLPFFPETSWAWAKGDAEGAEARARRAWEGSYQREGEGSDPAYGAFFAAAELELSEEFVQLADLFAPILAHLEATDAAA
jgi:exodeoxyribonuclease V gamma subunit